jgi:hypothetical protein
MNDYGFDSLTEYQEWREWAMGGKITEGAIASDSGVLRTFATGATRDTATNKPDYEGFLSPLVTKRFGEYMMVHQQQSDGSLRDSDNWQKGIPVAAYVKSMYRHFVDVLLHYDHYSDQATEPDLETALCALKFNVDGLLHETIKDRLCVVPLPQERCSAAEAKVREWVRQGILGVED